MAPLERPVPPVPAREEAVSHEYEEPKYEEPRSTHEYLDLVPNPRPTSRHTESGYLKPVQHEIPLEDVEKKEKEEEKKEEEEQKKTKEEEEQKKTKEEEKKEEEEEKKKQEQETIQLNPSPPEPRESETDPSE